MMIFNIFLNHLSCYFVSDTPYKISITPEFSAPKLLLDLWKSFEKFSGRYTLHNLNNFRWRIPRRNLHKHMNMIQCYFHRINLKIILLCNLFKNSLGKFFKLLCKQIIPIFWYPYKMIFQIIYCMFPSSNWTHAINYGIYQFINRGLLSSPQQAGEYSAVFFIKGKIITFSSTMAKTPQGGGG